ncbi:MAG TPA: tRNA adenosine(34) deaminase TadA [Clostridiales bacterium]|nr:tRNA adenosine(34) deaminase TadA [Clostridiales bacterium]HPP34806.1 tRNA adenosine(34) deaminase TadA [Clostridiales bacterium]
MAHDKPACQLFTHERFMAEALMEAEKARKKAEAPVGAVVVRNGVIIARGHNERESKNDSTLHAEMTAIRRACKKLGTWRLTDCDLYVTLEPCTMCAGAIIQSRIRTLYIGTSDLKAGAAGSVIDVFRVDAFNHRVDVVWGVLEQECSAILKEFFKSLRQNISKIL